jgi:hypothetical protein
MNDAIVFSMAYRIPANVNNTPIARQIPQGTCFRDRTFHASVGVSTAVGSDNAKINITITVGKLRAKCIITNVDVDNHTGFVLHRAH